MSALRLVNMVVAFSVELWMLWAYAEWAYHVPSAPVLRWSCALAAPLVASLLWAKWAAPKSRTRLRVPWLIGFEWCMFVLAAAAIYGVGRVRTAFVYLLIASTSLGLSAYYRDLKPPR